jgi:hypothetical protein
MGSVPADFEFQEAADLLRLLRSLFLCLRPPEQLLRRQELLLR